MDKAFKAEDKLTQMLLNTHVRNLPAEEAEELVRRLRLLTGSTVSNNEEPDVVFAAAGTEPNLGSS